MADKNSENGAQKEPKIFDEGQKILARETDYGHTT
jgi:hypothetical protein